MGERISSEKILWFFLALFLISIYCMGLLFWPFLSLIILGAIITGICKPFYSALERKTNPSFASLLTCFIVFIMLFIPITFFVGILSKEAYDLYLAAKSVVLNDEIKHFLESSRLLEDTNLFLARFNMQITGEELNKAVSEAAKTVGLFLYDQARSIASNMLVFLVDFFFMLLIIYYLLIDSDKLVSFIINLSPMPREHDEKLIQKFKDMAGAVLIGNGLGGLVQGILGGIVFALFDLRSPFLWGVIMGLLAFLPILGIGMVFIPVSIYFALNGRIGAGLFFFVFYIVLSGGIEYLFKPRLVGKRVKMHTLLVFLSIVGGLKLFGILGIIYGPLLVTAFLTLTDIYKSSYRKIM